MVEDVIVNHLVPIAESVLKDRSYCCLSKQNKGKGEREQKFVGAEWWTHTRHMGANLRHQLHFDTYEGLLKAEEAISHPLVSSVQYLTGGGVSSGDDEEEGNGGGGGAGRTVVFDQTPDTSSEGKVTTATMAWISHPRNNTH